MHPVDRVPGGMSKRVTKEEQQERSRSAREMVEFAKIAIRCSTTFVLANPAYVDLILSEAFSHRDLLDRLSDRPWSRQLLRRHGTGHQP